MSEASVINDLICSIGRREIFSTHCQSRYNWGMELNWNGINFVNKLKWWKNFRGKMWQTALENTMHIFYVQDRKQHTNYAELIIAKQRLAMDAMIAWMHIVCTLHGLKKSFQIALILVSLLEGSEWRLVILSRINWMCRRLSIGWTIRRTV